MPGGADAEVIDCPGVVTRFGFRFPAEVSAFCSACCWPVAAARDSLDCSCACCVRAASLPLYVCWMTAWSPRAKVVLPFWDIAGTPGRTVLELLDLLVGSGQVRLCRLVGCRRLGRVYQVPDGSTERDTRSAVVGRRVGLCGVC